MAAKRIIREDSSYNHRQDLFFGPSKNIRTAIGNVGQGGKSLITDDLAKYVVAKKDFYSYPVGAEQTKGTK
jgi:hypothetical protein